MALIIAMIFMLPFDSLDTDIKMNLSAATFLLGGICYFFAMISKDIDEEIKKKHDDPIDLYRASKKDLRDS